MDVIGSVLFTYYSYFFIMASVILLVAMIGAIALTLLEEVMYVDKKLYSCNEISRVQLI